MMMTGGTNVLRLPLGKKFDITAIEEQYTLCPGDTTQGLLKTQQLYQHHKDPHNGNYNFGKLTELYFNLHGSDKAHWRRSVATFAEIHPLLKSIVIAALTHEPNPLEIQWNWDEGVRPMGPDVKKGASIIYDSAALKYYILIFGYTMPG
jgi:hypothetical protein